MPREWVGQADAFKAIERGLKASVSKIAKAVNRRRHGRIRCSWVQCNLGAVVDLSAGGMAVMTHRPLEGEVDVELRHPDGRLSLRAKVVRSWPMRDGEYEHGLAFIAPTPEDVHLLGVMATDNGSRPSSAA